MSLSNLKLKTRSCWGWGGPSVQWYCGDDSGQSSGYRGIPSSYIMKVFGVSIYITTLSETSPLSVLSESTTLSEASLLFVLSENPSCHMTYSYITSTAHLSHDLSKTIKALYFLKTLSKSSHDLQLYNQYVSFVTWPIPYKPFLKAHMMFKLTWPKHVYSYICLCHMTYPIQTLSKMSHDLSITWPIYVKRVKGAVTWYLLEICVS